MASSIALSSTSQARWWRPAVPTPPMYMPGRLRTGSRPSRTVMSLAVYVEDMNAETRGDYTRRIGILSPRWRRGSREACENACHSYAQYDAPSEQSASRIAGRPVGNRHGGAPSGVDGRRRGVVWV